MLNIHARQRDGVWRYRLWTTESDCYCSKELDEAQLREVLLDDYSPRQVRERHAELEMVQRIERAQKYGTSARLADPVDVTGPWREDHHGFHTRQGLDGICSACGEPAGDPAHQPKAP